MAFYFSSISDSFFKADPLIIVSISIMKHFAYEFKLLGVLPFGCSSISNVAFVSSKEIIWSMWCPIFFYMSINTASKLSAICACLLFKKVFPSIMLVACAFFFSFIRSSILFKWLIISKLASDVCLDSIEFVCFYFFNESYLLSSLSNESSCYSESSESLSELSSSELDSSDDSSDSDITLANNID